MTLAMIVDRVSLNSSDQPTHHRPTARFFPSPRCMHCDLAIACTASGHAYWRRSPSQRTNSNVVSDKILSFRRDWWTQQ